MMSPVQGNVMGLDQIAVVLLGALAGGFVNGLTGFGTAITAMGLWLYAVSPPVAASLAIICSVISQIQTLPMIWRVIDWPRSADCRSALCRRARWRPPHSIQSRRRSWKRPACR